MPTIIDSLIITLGLDPKGFVDGSKKTEEASKKNSETLVKQANSIEAANEKAFKSYARLATEFLGFVGIATGAYEVKEFIGDVIKNNLAVSQLSTNLGISAEALSTWQGAVKLSGGQTKDLDASMSSLVTTYQNGIHGIVTSQVGAARALGIDFQLLKSPIDFLLATRTALQKYDKPEQAFYANLLGIGPDTLRLLQLNNDEFQHTMDLARRYNAVTGDSAERTKRAQTATEGWNQALGRVGNTLAIGVLPELTQLINGLDQALPKLAGFANSFQHEPLTTMKQQRDESFVGGWWEWIKTGHWPQPDNNGHTQFSINPDESPIDWDKIRGSAAPTPSGSGGANAMEAFFIKRGFTAAQAKGIVAGLSAENGQLDPLAREKGGSGYGLEQLTSKDRRAEYQRIFGHGIESVTDRNQAMAEQLAFISAELKGARGSGVRGAVSAQEAARAMVVQFESPAKWARQAELTRAMAYIGGLDNIPGAKGTGGAREVRIAQIGPIYTQATDAKGIAKDIGGAVNKYSFVTQSDGGVQ